MFSSDYELFVLNLDEFLTFQKEFAVVSFRAKYAFRVDAVDLYHVACDILEEIAIMTDYEAGESGAIEELVEPENPVQVRDGSSAHRAGARQGS